MLSYLTLRLTGHIKCTAQRHIVGCPARLAGLSFQLHASSLDMSQDGCHLWVFPVGRGSHVANGFHLVTLRLDTALIDDVGRAGVVGEVVSSP